MLVETPFYAGALPPLKKLKAECIGMLHPRLFPFLPKSSFNQYAFIVIRIFEIDTELTEVGIDDGGLSPDLLEGTLRDWPEGKKRPKCV